MSMSKVIRRAANSGLLACSLVVDLEALATGESTLIVASKNSPSRSNTVSRLYLAAARAKSHVIAPQFHQPMIEKRSTSEHSAI